MTPVLAIRAAWTGPPRCDYDSGLSGKARSTCDMYKGAVIVIGAGASGMMAAGKAAETGARTVLLEKGDLPGKKLLLTGNTRCNVTNTRDLDRFVEMFGPNGRFLYGAFGRYFRDDLLAFLRRHGMEALAEADGRVFPLSQDAADVLNALRRYMADHGVMLHSGTRVTAIEAVNGRVSCVCTTNETYYARAVVLATGGASYPGTGSTGDGYRIAAALGHTIVPLRPALVPLVVQDRATVAAMRGVSLRDVRLTAYRCPAAEIGRYPTVTRDYGRGAGRGKPPHPVIESRRGDVMVTHFGLSGPATLLISLATVEALSSGPASVSIDLFPDLEQKQMAATLQLELNSHGRRTMHNILEGLLPHKVASGMAAMVGVASDKPASQVGGAERDRLATLLKSLAFDIQGPLSMESAFVTAGGVSLKEVDPRTMASRLVQGLYLCGEVLDLDADTGGYNLQAAFSTGYLAGLSAASAAPAKAKLP